MRLAAFASRVAFALWLALAALPGAAEVVTTFNAAADVSESCERSAAETVAQNARTAAQLRGFEFLAEATDEGTRWTVTPSNDDEFLVSLRTELHAVARGMQACPSLAGLDIVMLGEEDPAKIFEIVLNRARVELEPEAATATFALRSSLPPVAGGDDPAEVAAGHTDAPSGTELARLALDLETLRNETKTLRDQVVTLKRDVDGLSGSVGPARLLPALILLAVALVGAFVFGRRERSRARTNEVAPIADALPPAMPRDELAERSLIKSWSKGSATRPSASPDAAEAEPDPGSQGGQAPASRAESGGSGEGLPEILTVLPPRPEDPLLRTRGAGFEREPGPPDLEGDVVRARPSAEVDRIIEEYGRLAANTSPSPGQLEDFQKKYVEAHVGGSESGHLLPATGRRATFWVVRGDYKRPLILLPSDKVFAERTILESGRGDVARKVMRGFYEVEIGVGFRLVSVTVVSERGGAGVQEFHAVAPIGKIVLGEPSGAA